MVNSILSTELSTTQLHIDLIAQDLSDSKSALALPSADLLAELLDLCPEQNVWIYEPDVLDSESGLVNAIFQLHASRGTIFHMSCLLDASGSVLEWTGPYDVSIPETTHPQVQNAMAA